MRRLAPTGRVINFGASSFVTGETRNLISLIKGVLSTPFYTPLSLMSLNKGIFGLNMLQLFEPPQAGQNPKETAMGRAFDGVMKGFEDKRFRAVVGKSFPLSQGGDAHSHLQSRSNIGKVVLLGQS
jgi:NADPH:quinone reductase-like Zn-dependent oxidoreductase